MEFLKGLVIGINIMFWLHIMATSSYKKTLVMKAKDQTAEHINGKFYYIVEETKKHP